MHTAKDSLSNCFYLLYVAKTTGLAVNRFRDLIYVQEARKERHIFFVAHERIMNSGVDLTFRLAQPGDFDEIVKLSEGIYNGHDYLPLTFHQWLQRDNLVVIPLKRSRLIFIINEVHCEAKIKIAGCRHRCEPANDTNVFTG